MEGDLVVKGKCGRPKGFVKCKVCRVWIKPNVVHVCEVINVG